MCTEHCIERASERTGYMGKTALRFIENGIARGKSAKDFKQDESEYLLRREQNNCTARVYNGFCFIISEYGECITLYRLPHWFGKKRHYDSKTRIRNAKKYLPDTAPIDLASVS